MTNINELNINLNYLSRDDFYSLIIMIFESFKQHNGFLLYNEKIYLIKIINEYL